MINFVACGAVALLAGLAIRQMVKDKKAGKGSCGCDCSKCHNACSARPK